MGKAKKKLFDVSEILSFKPAAKPQPRNSNKQTSTKVHNTKGKPSHGQGKKF